MCYLKLIFYSWFFFCAGLLHAATFTYSYDSLNRITNAAYSDGSSESYSYDDTGNRTSRSTSAATIQTDTVSPSIPTNLTTNGFTPSQLNISWKQASDTGGAGLAGYYVYVNGSLVATTTMTNFNLHGLYPSTTYCLSVAAFDHENNMSEQSPSVCCTTPVFQPPYLQAPSVANGVLQFGVTGGTVGPYEVLGSSNLVDWRDETNVWLPFTNGGFLPLAVRTNGAYFYRLEWSTNVGDNISVASASPITVTLTAVGSGSGYFTVDGTDYSAPQTFDWPPGSSHTIGANALPSGSSHILVSWSGWSDGGAITHMVRPSVSTNYTATFKMQCWLAINAEAGGTVSPASGWYDYGQTVKISATPANGYNFSGWTCSDPQAGGTYVGMDNPATVTANSWFTETANFTNSP